MKKTISINLAGLVYQIDEDAYNLLDNYLEKLRSTFTKKEEQEEIIEDIEHRFAELFSQNLGKRTEVVNFKMVQDAINTLGDMELIEEESDFKTKSQKNSETSRTDRKLFRSTDDKVIAGVLGGLGIYLGVNPIWLRLIFILLAIASIGVPVGFIYLIMWALLPKALTASQKLQMQGEPVNLNNLKENLKKNLSSEELKSAGNSFVSSVGSLVHGGIKTIIIALTAFILFNIVVISFTWFFGVFFINFMGGEYVSLIFDSKIQFFVLSVLVYLLMAIPSFLAVYLVYRAKYKQGIEWAKVFFVSLGVWFFVLVATVISILSVVKEFKTGANAQSYIDLALNDSIQELHIEFDEVLDNEDWSFNYGKGGWQTDGFVFDAESQLLKLRAVSLQIEVAADDKFSLLASAQAQGEDRKDAESYLDNFTYEIEVKNGNTLVIPNILTLENEDKFRCQRLTYTLSVPIGSKLSFGSKVHDYVKDAYLESNRKKKEIDGNTWLMTSNGLQCLTCPEFELELEESIEETLDSLGEKMEMIIEKEIEKI